MRRKVERQELERQTAQYKRKEEIAKEFGFESPEEVWEVARLKKESPDEFNKWKDGISARKEPPTFPTKQETNTERRQELLKEQLSNTRKGI